MAAAPVKQRTGGTRAQLPPCYYEGYLEKRGSKEKVSRRLWTCLCGNTLFFFNNTKDSHYVEKLDLSGFVSLIDDCGRDRNLEAARLNLRMKDGEIKLTAPNLEARELWKGFIYSVVDLTVPTTLTLLPGQVQVLKEVVEKERYRRRAARSLARAPASPLSVPLVGEIPACFRPVSRTEAEVLLERHPDCGNMLLRPGRDGSSLAVTTRQDLNGTVCMFLCPLLMVTTSLVHSPSLPPSLPPSLSPSVPPSLTHPRSPVVHSRTSRLLLPQLLHQLGLQALPGDTEAAGWIHHRCGEPRTYGSVFPKQTDAT
ncbi:signal-transducing adaptor protein 2-like isoform X2 [Brachyhypopomus gauderio]|uniref:signal-transducing adaptor protein 2a isoform X2 n=1 Tax=Brachyhypopomus gauderio TaxID=698409 RepID=UPI0040412F4D